MATANLLELLYLAFNSRYGIAVTTSDPVRLKQQFYTERKKDPDLACLSFLTSPLNPQGEVIILKTGEQQDG